MCSIAMLAYNGLMGTEYTPSGTAHFTDTNDPDVNAAYDSRSCRATVTAASARTIR